MYETADGGSMELPIRTGQTAGADLDDQPTHTAQSLLPLRFIGRLHGFVVGQAA